MKKSFAIALVMIFFNIESVWAAPNWLVTPDEVAKELVYAKKMPANKSFTKAISPGAPEILMVTPSNLSQPLNTPFPIQLSFQAKDGAVVLPETFKALYGTFKLDITSRIIKKSKVTAEGIVVERADIPTGNHRLVLRVTDDQGRRGETELKFTVQE